MQSRRLRFGRSLITPFLPLLVLFLSWGLLRDASAKPVVYQAVGTREVIQPTIDRFKHDIVYGPTGDADHPPATLGTFKVATFDDQSLLGDSTVRRPVLESGGLRLEGNCASLALSAAGPDDNPKRLFGDVNPVFPSIFTAFSPSRVISMTDRSCTDPHSAYFVVMNNEALGPRHSAFGAVFIHVGSSSAPALAGFLGEMGGSFQFAAQPSGEQGPFSFVGIIDDAAPFNLCWIALPSVLQEGTTDGAVAVDDVMLGWTPTRSPIVTRFEPAQGSVGTGVEIWGTDIMEATSVEFNGVPSFASGILLNRLMTRVPEGASTGPITVRTRTGSYTTMQPFTVVAIPPPVITSVSPNKGWEGQSVTIQGENLMYPTALSFNGTAAAFMGMGGAIFATIPANAKTGPITVSTKQGSFTTAEPFTILEPHYDLPVITDMSPLTGLPGSNVQIRGTGNLDRVSRVRFNGVEASFRYDSIMFFLSVVVPAGARTGPITLQSPEGTVTSPAVFVVPPYAIVSGFTPEQGTPGPEVEIQGEMLGDVTKIWLGNLEVPFARGERPHFTVPRDGESGPIIIEADQLRSTSPREFIVLHDVPLITGFSPESGPPGTPVQIFANSPPGSIEDNNLDRTVSVWFGAAAAAYSYDATQAILTAIVPPGAASGPIQVFTSDGVAVSTNSFTVIPGAVLTGFTPNHGPPGAPVELLGTGLDQVTRVRVGRKVATWNDPAPFHFTVPADALSAPVVMLTPFSRQVSTDMFIVERPFDVRAQVEAELTSVMVPTHIDYSVKVLNNGPDLITAVVLTNTVFMANEFVVDPWSTFSAPGEGDGDTALSTEIVTASQGHAVLSGEMVRWDVGDLPGYATAILRLSVQATQAGVVYALATAAADEPDPDLRNNQFALPTLLADAPLLMIQKRSPGALEIGWPSATTNWVLQARKQAPDSPWLPVPGAITNSAGWNRIRDSISPAGSFYRLAPAN